MRWRTSASSWLTSKPPSRVSPLSPQAPLPPITSACAWSTCARAWAWCLLRTCGTCRSAHCS
eukprot:scaffold169588_cov17-Tisochrysis_lutea.AAC.1